MGKLFEWARPHKKHIYYLNEGSLDEQRKFTHQQSDLTIENMLIAND